MPRTPVALTTPLSSYPTLPLAANSADLVTTAADVSNKNQVAYGNASRLLIIAINTHTATSYTVSITSAPDAFGRLGDIATYQLEAGNAMIMILNRDGWRQSDGQLYLEANNASVVFGAVRL